MSPPRPPHTAARAAQAVFSGGDQAMQSVTGAIVREPILQGEPVIRGKIVKGGEGGYMSVVLQPGMRAMAIPVTVETGAGGFILPGDRVDVISSHKLDQAAGAPPGGGNADGGTVAQVILANLRVLAIDQQTEPAKNAKSIVGSTATLEVPAESVDILARAKSLGDMSLVLRSYADLGAPSVGHRAGGGAGRAHLQGRPHRPGGHPMTAAVRSLTCFAAVLAALGASTAAPAQMSLAGGPRAGGYSPAPDSASPPGVLRVTLSTAGPTTRTLALGKGKSAQVELPVDARDITVTNPAVADVILRTPRRISVLGLAVGETDATFVDGVGHPILTLDIRVDQDISAVSETIARVLPGAQVKVEAVNTSLILTGQVANAEDADKAQRIAQQFTAKPDDVLNMLTIAGKQQVMLKVRIVEVQRSSIKQLGLNTSFAMSNGLQTYGFTQGATYGVNGSSLGGASACIGQNGQKTTTYNNSTTTNNATAATAVSNAATTAFSRIFGTNASGCLAAFERAGLVRTLAEPNLTAVSGDNANFLAGGEFPVPTGQGHPGARQRRVQAVRRQPQLHPGGAVERPHLAEDLHRGVGADQPGLVHDLQRHVRRAGPDHPRPDRAAGADDGGDAVGRRDDDRRPAAGRIQAGHRLPARDDEPAGARRPVPLARLPERPDRAGGDRDPLPWWTRSTRTRSRPRPTGWRSPTTPRRS